MFVRKKTLGKHTYYYLVETKREGVSVKQTSVKYLGKQKPSKEYIDGIIAEVMQSRGRNRTNDSGNSHIQQ